MGPGRLARTDWHAAPGNGRQTKQCHMNGRRPGPSGGLTASPARSSRRSARALAAGSCCSTGSSRARFLRQWAGPADARSTNWLTSGSAPMLTDFSFPQGTKHGETLIDAMITTGSLARGMQSVAAYPRGYSLKRAQQDLATENHLMKSKSNLLVTALLILTAVRVPAATLPPGFSRETAVASGLNAPTAMEFARDGQLFVCQQAGSLRVIKNSTLLGTPFLSVTTDSSGERGLLGVTFSPVFTTTNGFMCTIRWRAHRHTIA